jgi:autotransporter-associated beta strand protein
VACGGIYNGLTSTIGVTNLTVSGSGTLSLNSGIASFYMGAATYNTILKLEVSGSGTMQNQSSGSLFLAAANSYTGGFSFGTGSGVNINNGFAFGTGKVTNSVASTVLATPALDSAGNAFATSAITITNSWAVCGAANTEIMVGAAGIPITFSGPFALAGSGITSTQDMRNTFFEISGVVSGAGNLIKTSGGTLYLSGNNTYSGKTTIGGGSIAVDSYNKVTGGTASSSLGHPTTTANGTIAIGGTSTTGTNIYVGLGETTDRVIDLSGSSGGATIEADGSGPVVFSSALTASGAGVKKLTLLGTNSGNNTLSGKIVDSSGGATSLAKAGSGKWILGGTSTFTGTATVNGGILSISADANLGTAPGTATAGAMTINGGTLQHTSAGVGSTWLAGNRGVAVGASGATLDIPAAAAILIYTSGQITGAKNPVTKTGAGTLRITTPTSMTYSNLTVTGGLWQGGLDTIYGATPAALNAANITLNGGGISANAGLVLGANRGITIGAAGGQIDCSSTLTIPGPITGTGNLTKSGANALNLTGANTYSGKTTITNAGITVSSYNSVAGGVASSSLGAPTTVANGTISIGFGSVTCSNVYIGPGEVTDRVLDFAGTTGGVTLEADGTGALEFTSDPTFSGAGGTKVITLVGTNTGIIDGVIANSAGGATAITKSGTGTWTLNGDNTYTGNTTLNTAGKLNFGSQYAIGSGTFVINQNGLFDNTTGGDITVTNAMAMSGGSPTYVGSANNMTLSGPVSISAANRTITVSANTLTIAQGITQDSARGFTKAGAGTLKLQGANGWTVNTTVSAGTLALDGSATLASTGLVIGAAGNFDVSTLASPTFTLGMSLTATGTGAGAASITGASGGTFDVGTSNIVLTFAPTTFNGDLTHPALIISQGTLSVSGNFYTVNNAGGTALGVGVYRLIQQSTGNINASGTALSGGVTGSGLAGGTTGSIVVNGSEIDLVVTATGTITPAQGSMGTMYGTAAISLSGTVSGVGPTYPADGETVAVTINGNTQNATISGGLGGFTLIYNTTGIPASGTPYTITYSYAGDGSLTAGSDASTTLTMSQAALTVTANDQSKVYGQTIATGPGDTNFSSSALQYSETIGSVTLAVSSGGDGANAAVAGSPYTITPSAATGGTFNPNNYNITYATGNLTVTAASLTVTATGTLTYGEDPSNAVYVASYAPLQGTDDVSVVTGAGNYSTDATATNYVGTNYIAHIVDLGTLSSPNYTLVAGADGVLTITNRPLYATNVLASDKIYDATTAATADLSGAGLTNFVNGDEASVSLVTTGASAVFADKNAGSNKTVTVTGLATAGDLGTNYFVAPAMTTASIGQYVTNVTVVGGDRYYDSTTNASASANFFQPLGSDDVYAGTYQAYFADKNAGVGKTVYVPVVLLGADAANYSIPSIATTTATISPYPLSIGGGTGVNKVYDGTIAATVNLLDNHYAGDDITDTYTNASFDNKNVGIAVGITVTGIGFTGADAGNYTLASSAPQTTWADITVRALTVSATGINKVYDGTTAATVTLSDDKVPGDDVSDSYTSAAFADKNVNAGIAVSVSDISISGGDAGNYSLVNTTASTTANITSEGLTVSGVVVLDKVYDGTTNATVTLTNAALVGVSGSDDVTLVTSNAVAAFADKNVGSNKVVTVSELSIAGADAGNYALVQPSTNASITPATLTVSATGVNKVYDSTTAATVTLSDDKIAGDDVTDAYTTAAFADKNVNTGIAVSVSGVSISGADAGNYALASTSASTSADITARSLTVIALGVNKAYNGDASATVTLSDDKVDGDDVTDSYTAAAFADKNAGAGKAVSVSGISISGGDAANYALANTTASTSADITARTLTVSASAANKPYDGTTTASATLSDNKVLGDDVSETYTTADFSDANAGTGKTVTVSGISISGGADAGNYSLASTTAATTADITAAASSAAIVSSLNPSIETSNVTFTATISAGVGTPSGDVVFLANGTPFSTNALVAGVASADSASLPVGTNAIAAQYAAQGNYLGSSASLDQVVNSAVTLSTNNVIASIVNNGDGTFTVNAIGTPTALYYLQSTADLNPPIAWSLVPGSTNTAATGTGTWSFVVTNAPPAYYRSTAVNPAP